MQKISPKNLFPLKFISDFHKINIRTYVDNNDKKKVYFLNIEAEKAFVITINVAFRPPFVYIPSSRNKKTINSTKPIIPKPLSDSGII